MSELEQAAADAKQALLRLNAARAIEKTSRQAAAAAEELVRQARVSYEQAQMRLARIAVDGIQHENWF